MKKITIGIPQTLLYFKYKDLWTTFFKNLGCEIVLSPKTDRSILENGIKYSCDESCMAMKIFMGHVHYLIDKCDYIFIPRLECIKKDEKLCTNFSALYDLVRNTFDIKIIHYNIDLKNHQEEQKAFNSLGKSLGFVKSDIEKAYLKAIDKMQNEKENKIHRQKNILKNSEKLKILLAGHPYNLYDEFLGGQIKKVLKDYDVEIIYSDVYDDSNLEEEVKNITKMNYWTYNKEMIGAVEHYKNKVDGIILITSFPCGPDSLSNEMILRNIDIPITNLIIDEADSTTGLLTRIESFIDIIEERKRINE